MLNFCGIIYVILYFNVKRDIQCMCISSCEFWRIESHMLLI